MKVLNIVGLAGAMALAASAEAATVVQLDVNSITASANSPGFGPGYTGNLTLTSDSNSGLFGMLKNGTGGPGIGFGGPYTGANFAFAATFSFTGGSITGIGFNVMVSSAMNAVFDNVYSASIVPGVGNVVGDPGKPGSFIVAAATTGGSFNASSFGGVDVSSFFAGNLPGNFINFKIDGGLINGAAKTDPDVDIDIFVRDVAVPLPTPVGMASAGLIGLAALRRRRA